MKDLLLKRLNKIIAKQGKENYQIDPALGILDLCIIVFSRMIQLLRGFFLRISFKRSKFPLFVGRGVVVKHGHKIKVGKNVFFGDGVILNALSKTGVEIGNNFSLHARSVIDCTGVFTQLGEGLVIGDNVGISQNCFLQVRGRLTIESDVIIGPGVSVFTENHNFTDQSQPIRLQGVTRGDVFIGRGSWIGANATVLSGVKIGKNCVIAAGSVVNRNIDDFEIVAGVPAKSIKPKL